MGTGSSGDVITPCTALVCCNAFVLLIGTTVWISLRKALGSSALPSSPKELITISKGSINGLVGGLIGGSICMSIFATSVFPTERVSLVNGMIVWAIIGGLLGMVGGGIGGLVNDRRYGKSNRLIDWATAGAMLSPLVLGAGAMVGVSVGGIGISLGGGGPLLAIPGGAFLGATGAAYLQEKANARR